MQIDGNKMLIWSRWNMRGLIHGTIDTTGFAPQINFSEDTFSHPWDYYQPHGVWPWNWGYDVRGRDPRLKLPLP
jgi:hypothetical protein